MSNIDSLLNTTCSIQTLSKTYNAKTRQQVESWANLATGVPCRIDMAGGGERRTATDKYLKTTHICYMGYRTDFAPQTHRIVARGNNYNILRISRAGGIEHHLEIDLELVN